MPLAKICCQTDIWSETAGPDFAPPVRSWSDFNRTDGNTTPQTGAGVNSVARESGAKEGKRRQTDAPNMHSAVLLRWPQ